MFVIHSECRIECQAAGDVAVQFSLSDNKFVLNNQQNLKYVYYDFGIYIDQFLNVILLFVFI